MRNRRTLTAALGGLAIVAMAATALTSAAVAETPAVDGVVEVGTPADAIRLDCVSGATLPLSVTRVADVKEELSVPDRIDIVAKHLLPKTAAQSSLSTGTLFSRTVDGTEVRRDVQLLANGHTVAVLFFSDLGGGLGLDRAVFCSETPAPVEVIR